MQKLASEIQNFIARYSETPIILHNERFPKTPFVYLFLPEKKLIFHCIDLNTAINEPFFFQNLSNEFAKQNLKIIHLWKDVWQAKQAIVESRILSLLGKSETIPARLTQVRRIDKLLMDRFLTINHLQGSVNAKLKFGLFLPKQYFRVISNENLLRENAHFDEILVAIATFSNAKKIIREGQEFRSYELIRFANLKDFTVVGGLNKLLKNFIREQNPDDIMTYADGDWSDGSNYEKIGFTRIEQTEPLAFELDNQTFMRKKNDIHIVGQKVYNAGNWKFLMKVKDER